MVVMPVQPFVSYAFWDYTFFYKYFFCFAFLKSDGGCFKKIKYRLCMFKSIGAAMEPDGVLGGGGSP